MTRLALTIAALCVAAVPASADTIGCGGNATSYAEVDEHPPGHRQRGPVMAVPDTLCADLVERRPRSIDSLNITIDPYGSAERTGPAGTGRRPVGRPR